MKCRSTKEKKNPRGSQKKFFLFFEYRQKVFVSKMKTLLAKMGSFL